MSGRLETRTLRQPATLVISAILLAFLLQQLIDLGLLEFLGPLLAAAILGLVLARHPWVAFAILVMTVPFQRFGSEGTLLPTTLTQMVFPVALAGSLVVLLASRRPARGHITLLPFVVLLLVMVASSIGAASMGAAWSEISRWFVALAAFWIALQFVVGSSERRLIGFVALIAAGGVFEATIGVVQSVVGFGPFEVSSGISRAYGTFGRPNSYAGYLEMTLFPAIALTIWYSGEVIRRYHVYAIERLQGLSASRDVRIDLGRAIVAVTVFAGSAGVILGGIVASLSRGAWLGVAVAGLATALLLGPKTRLVTAVVGLTVAGLIVSGQGSLVPENVRERVVESVEQFGTTNADNVPITDDNFATVERLAHWQSGMAMYRDHPALGIGIGNYNERFEEYAVRDEFSTSQGHAHNYYIHTLAETGLLGLLAYLSLLGSIIALALRVVLARTARGTLARAIVLGALGSIIAVATHNFFENLHVLNLGIVISLLWALVIAGHERWRAHEFEPA